MNHLPEKGFEAGACELLENEAMEAKWFLVWVGMWIVALAALLPALM